MEKEIAGISIKISVVPSFKALTANAVEDPIDDIDTSCLSILRFIIFLKIKKKTKLYKAT